LSTDVYTRKIILNKIIGESLLTIIANEQKVTIAEVDIQKTYDGYVQQSGNAADVEQYIKTLYGWNVEQFKLKLIKPQVIQEKLAEKYFADVKSQVATIREKVTAATFADTASKESQDAQTAVKGGAIELNTKTIADEYTAEAVKTIIALGDKQISAVLETSRGYEIVLLEKKVSASKKADGTVYSLRRIVKTPDFNTWLSDLVTAKAEKLRVMLFEPRFRWEAACGVLAKSEPSCKDTTNTNQNTNTNE
ncbi:MAG: peptidylprolyl isomerase, partial [Patescibacteria group bacterium]